jgi:hypothetical protein
MTKLVKVVELKALPGHRLWVKFSDGSEGTRDYSDVIKDGGNLLTPLHDQTYFEKVFLSFGIPTWPNGLDFDAVNLRVELLESGSLNVVAA